MDEIMWAAFIAATIAIVLQTGISYYQKWKKDGREFQLKFVATALLSWIVAAVPTAYNMMLTLEIPEGVGWLEVGLAVFAIAWGLDMALNKYGITLWGIHKKNG